MKLSGRNLSADLQGDDVALLHTELTAIGLVVPPAEVAKKAYGRGTAEAVQQFQKQNGLQVTGVVDERTATQINRVFDNLPNGHQPPAEPARTVSGVVAAPTRGTMPELTVVVSDRSLRHDDALVETRTDADGRYVATYLLSTVQARGKAAPDLVVTVLSGKAPVGTSQVRYDAGPVEVIDVLLDTDATGLTSEHEAITHAVAAHFTGGLGELREDDEHADLSYLSRKTGWDARAVALAATAAQLAGAAAQRDGAVLSSEHFYALLRSGVAATPEAVYSLHPKLVEQVWEQAAQAGLVTEAVVRDSGTALKAYRRLAVTHSLDVAAVPGTSTLRQLAQRVLGDNVQEQQTFAGLLADHGTDPSRLWQAVGESLGADKAKALRLDGQLALLTLDNAPLVGRLHDVVGDTLASAADLPHAGFHDAAAWLPLLADTPPPDVVTGPDDESRRRRYADVLAAQVRVSYPTAVTAALVGAGTVPVTAARDDVHRFLSEHADTFQIGMEPVRRYVGRVGAAVEPEVVTQVQRLQRVYQLTRDDASMAALLQAGIGSAAAVVRLGTPQLMRTFGDALGETAVREISAKALQVHLATLNVAGAYLTTRSAPALGGTGARIVDPSHSLSASTTAAVVEPPDLEQLFGSMDLCGCDECRSVLSPAAYLVDLLDFADQPTGDGSPTPLQVLLQRRPDLQHLPLSCENTNTPLPYIDVVNEALEHFVVHGLSLADYLGHDTDEHARPEDLLAGPQFVEEAAYALLKDQAFPPPLPFNRPLEQLRRHVRALAGDVDFATVLDDLRAGDAIDRTSATGYGVRDVLMERLGLSRQEHALLTTHTTTLPDLYGLAAGTSPAQAVTAMSNAKAFARQARVGYDDVVQLVTTRFVNPHAVLIPALRHLGLPMATLARVHAGTITDPELAALLPDGVSTAAVHDFVTANYQQARRLVVLQQQPDSDPRDFAGFTLAHNDPDAADNTLSVTQFVQLARFIRLWRTLGWTIGQVDAAVTALYPAADLPTDPDVEVALGHLDAGFATLLLRLGVVRTVMTRLKVRPGDDLEPLLTLWAPISRTAPGSLYERLFLAPTLLAIDPAFARNADGSVLTDATRTVGTHLDTLRAATGLTGPEAQLVVDRLPQGAATPLTVDAVSAVYRHAWLARRLRLSIAELTTLVDHTGLDPFAVPEPDGVHRQPAILDLLDLLDELRAARIKPAQFAYLAFDTDLTGTSAIRSTDVAALARTLRSGFADVNAQFTVIDDPTGEITRARLALVYGEPAADFLFGLVNGTFSVTVPYSFEHPDDFVEPMADATAGRLTYDDLRKTLTYAGVLQPDVRAAIAAITDIPATLVTAVDALGTQGATQTAAFFARYPELETGYQAFLASNAPVEQRRRTLLDAFLPPLIRRRRAQQALACLSAVLRVDPLLTSAVADNVAVLHADADPGSAALADLTGTATTGLDTQLFFSATVTAVPDLRPDPTPTLDYGVGQPLPHGPGGPGSPVSGVWTGHLEAATSDTYELAIDTDAASVHLLLDGAPATLDHDGNRWRTHDPLPLTGGTLLAVWITAEGLGTTLTLRQRSTGLGWQVVPAARLYPASALQHLASTYAQVGKAVSLATAARLTPDELTHLATDPRLAVAGGAWPNTLRYGDPGAAATDPALTGVLREVLSYGRLKARFAPADDRLLRLVQAPDATDAAEQLTGWPTEVLDTVLTRIGHTRADLAGTAVLGRLVTAATTVAALGTSATAALAAATNDPTSAQVAAFGTAVRARYAEADWLAVLRPINDELRALQRDALVAYVLRRLAQSPATANLDTPDKLFEYFLMDVEMQPVMQTSRIRHALSSVQLFIERCLMNLEPQVSPSHVDAVQWSWMKRYRVWEAARKVFLWPENWLEPELRDDQSPIFKDVVGELLQGDVTDDRASAALTSYLTRLEEVAHLEPCGVYVDEQGEGSADDVVHVIARTTGAHRKYFYRRREYGYWTAWEPVKLDIEDNPVVPVVWKGRLFVFWLRLIKATPTAAASIPTTGPTGPVANLSMGQVKSDAVGGLNAAGRMQVHAVLSYSEYVGGAWQPVRTSDPDKPTLLGGFPAGGSGAFDRLALQLGTTGESSELVVHISGAGGSHFRLYTSHSLPVRDEDDNPDGLTVITLYQHPDRRWLTVANAALSATYQPAGMLSFGPGKANLERKLVTGRSPMRVVAPNQSIDDPWDAPFLVSDAQHAFYVETTQEPVKISDGGYGVGGTAVGTVALPDLPQLLWPEIPQLVNPPDPWKSVVDPAIGVIDTSPVAWGLSEDVRITRAVGSVQPVTFNGRQIGPAGAVDVAQRQR